MNSAGSAFGASTVAPATDPRAGVQPVQSFQMLLLGQDRDLDLAPDAATRSRLLTNHLSLLLGVIRSELVTERVLEKRRLVRVDEGELAKARKRIDELRTDFKKRPSAFSVSVRATPIPCAPGDIPRYQIVGMDPQRPSLNPAPIVYEPAIIPMMQFVRNDLKDRVFERASRTLDNIHEEAHFIAAEWGVMDMETKASNLESTWSNKESARQHQQTLQALKERADRDRQQTVASRDPARLSHLPPEDQPSAFADEDDDGEATGA